MQPTRHRPQRSPSADRDTELSRATAEVVRLRTALAQVNGAADLVAAKSVAATALQANNN